MTTELDVVISVSGGRTSAYLAVWMHQNRDVVEEHLGAKVNLHSVFANTGMEHDDTLRYLHDVDQHFGLGVVWLEGYPTFGKRVSTRHRITNYQDCYRNGQWMDEAHPFHAFIRKYGIPNPGFLGCTREMKRNTIESWIRSNVHSDHRLAIGIRSDERRRVSKTERRPIIYPLVDWHPVTKDDVLAFWEDYDFDLAIPEWLGNCIMCYKKSFPKLALAHRDFPQAFEFTRAMEARYPRVGPEFTRHVGRPDRKFFRTGMSTEEMLAHVGRIESPEKRLPREEDDGGCTESCEPWPTENA